MQEPGAKPQKGRGAQAPMDDLWQDGEGRGLSEESLVVDLAGFEGPLDLLLHLARTQKVDLTRISVLALAEQYLVFIDKARRIRIELAADYLVMAAWLAYLKSRLLIPKQAKDEGPSGEEMAASLGVLQVRLSKIISAMPNIGRVHVMKVGDGAVHLHVWVMARTARMTHVLGSPAIEWDEILPPVPEDVWRANLRAVATALAATSGRALV